MAAGREGVAIQDDAAGGAIGARDLPHALPALTYNACNQITDRNDESAMELVRGLHNVRPQHRGCVLTIGAFDGVHRGHQEMFRVVRERASQHGLPAAVLSFEPTPREFFAKTTPPARLTRFREKAEALRSYGIDRFICLRFDEHMRAMSQEKFVEEVLVASLGVRHIVVGHDFRFARDHDGSVATLRAYGPRCDFAVTEVPPFEVEGERVSSSLIREALDAGDMQRARKFLGRPYRMTGKVIHGAKLGRTLGYPTANLRLHRRATPVAGVFAVRVSGCGLNRVPMRPLTPTGLRALHPRSTVRQSCPPGRVAARARGAPDVSAQGALDPRAPATEARGDRTTGLALHGAPSLGK